MPQLPVILSAFANSPDQAHLGQLKAEHDYLLEVFLRRPDLRHTPLLYSRVEQLLQFIQEYSADLQILHFGGHANGKQLFLEDQAGQGIGLARLLSTCPQLKLVVLNGCNTQAQADVYLAMGIPAVIATTCSVADGQATKFAQFLYRALANHQSIEHAFRQAMGAMEFAGEAVFDDSIVVYRGLERPKGDDQAPWRLYIQEEREGEIKTWTLLDQERLGRLMGYYGVIKIKPPRGVRFLDQYLTKETTATKYKHYLSEGVLPYYSMDAFHLEKEAPEAFFSEQKMIKTLLEDPYIEGGIISGKGGVGKTRLMLQMGVLAHEQGWNVLVLNDRFEDEAELGEFFDALERKRHLLLIDYIEECSWFNDSFMDEVKAHCHHVEQVRFLANCRNSFDYPSSSAYLDIPLDQHALRNEYEAWVVENIVWEFKSQLQEEARRRFYIKKPSFAVFLCYLQQRHPDKNLLEVGDFKDWLIKRFVHTVDTTRKSIKQFGNEIKWLICFPLTRAEKEEYLKDDSNFKLTLDALIKDGWIEESNLGGVISWRIVQDTVMDELAVAYFEGFSDLKTELLNSFEQALKLGKGKNWMWAIHRIRDTNLLQGKKEVFYEVFRKGLKNENTGDFALSYELGHTALIDENQRFELITRFPLFFESLTRKVTFALPLSYAMNWYANQREKAPTNLLELTKEWLKQWGEGKVVATALKAKLLSTYVKLYGFDEVVEPLFEQFFRSKVVWEGSYILEVYLENKQPITKKVKKYLKQYLDEFAGQKELHFVISAWLNAGEDHDIIQNSLINFLNKNAEEKEASFVIQAWLNVGGDKNFIQNNLINYLIINAEVKEAQFVINAWLNAGGDKNIIQNSLINFLNKNAGERESSFVIQAWLDAEGDKNIIQNSLINFLNINAKEKEARFVLCAWLKAGGDKNIIQNNLFDYLNHNAEEKEVQFVITAWLNAGGDKNIIPKSLISYLNHNAEEKEVRFVLCAWLNAGGDKNIIQNNLFNYLNKNAEERELSFVIQAWLDAEGDKNIIQNSLINYLNKNAEEREASFVIQAWLNAEGDKNIIQNSLINYFNKNAEEKELQFILTAWLNAGGNKNIIQNSLINYLNKNAEEKEAQFVLTAWLNAGGDKTIIQNSLVNYLKNNTQEKEVSFVLQTWLDAGGDKNIIQNSLVNYLNKNAEEKEAQFVLTAWLNAGGDKTIIQNSLINYLNKNAEEKEARFVLKAWMDNSGDISVIKKATLSFLRKNSKELEASFAIQAWLDAKGELDLIQEVVSNYLNKYAEEKEARFVLKSWLDAKGNPFLVKGAMLKNLYKHVESKESQFVINAWLNTTGEVELIKDIVLSYLNKFAEERESQFVINAWINANGDIQLIKGNTIRYLKKNAEDKEIRFVLATWLNAKGDIDSIKEATSAYLKKYPEEKETQYVINAWLNANGGIQSIKEATLTYLNKYAQEKEASFVFKSWFLAGGNFADLASYFERFFNSQYHHISSIYTVANILLNSPSLKKAEEYAQKVIQVHASTQEIGLVHWAWLESGRPFTAIFQWTISYVNIHPTYKRLYLFYLKSMEDIDYSVVVEDKISTWILYNLQQPEALPVFIKWIQTYQDESKILNLLTQLQQADQLPHFYLTLPPEGSPERAMITPYLQAWEKNYDNGEYEQKG